MDLNALGLVLEGKGAEALKAAREHLLAWPRDALQPCCQGRRLANDSPFLRLRLADQVPDDNEAGRDADPYLQVGAIRCGHPAHVLGDR